MVWTIIVVLLPAAMLIGALILRTLWLRRDSRRDPVNIKVLRGAGDGLRERMGQHFEAFDSGLVFFLMLGPIMYVAWSQRWLQARGFSWDGYTPGSLDYLLLAVMAISLVIGYFRMARHVDAVRRYRRALAAELATAQCLSQVMSEGGLVFHDFPGDGFNIDHIVIGHSAVFAVETKSRLKPATGGKESAHVAYEGRRLQFPTHVETRPIDQARHQAEWLARFLASGVGEPVRVIPYLALPGWFVENKVARPEVLVGNPRNPMFMVREGFGPPMGDSLKRRIAHVLSERYPARAG